MQKEADAARLPQSPEAEIAVLGSLFFDPNEMVRVVPILLPADFHVPANRVVAQVLWDFFMASRPIDVTLVYDELQRRGQLNVVNGHEGLKRLADAMPEASHAAHYARIVNEKAQLRALITTCEAVILEAMSNEATPEMVEGAERRIAAIIRPPTTVVTVGEAVRDEIRKIDDLMPRERVLTGLLDLDHDTGGFWQGEVTLLGARPSMGKTTLALNICKHIAGKLQVPALFCSLEMTSAQLARNLMACHAHVDGRSVREGRVAVEDYPKLLAAVVQLSSVPFFLCETARSIVALTALVKRCKQQYGIRLVVIDHLQLVHAPGQTIYQQRTAVSNWLKELAVDNHVAVLALSQLRRADSQLKLKRPRLDDLRDSGALEQDADVVLLLHREDYYRKEIQDNMAEIRIAKNRNGPTRDWGIQLVFFRDQLRFENAAWEQGVDDGGRNGGDGGGKRSGPAGGGGGQGPRQPDGKAAAAGERCAVQENGAGPLFRGPEGAGGVGEGHVAALKLAKPAISGTNTPPERATMPQDGKLEPPSTPETTPAPGEEPFLGGSPDLTPPVEDDEPRWTETPEEKAEIDAVLKRGERH